MNNKRRFPKVGDFVQKGSWFGDVWAEIKEVNEIVPGYKCIRYYDDIELSGVGVSHEYLGSALGTMRFYQFRQMKTLRQLQRLPRKEVRIIHCKEGTYGRTKNLQDRSLNGWPKFLQKKS